MMLRNIFSVALIVLALLSWNTIDTCQALKLSSVLTASQGYTSSRQWPNAVPGADSFIKPNKEKADQTINLESEESTKNYTTSAPLNKTSAHPESEYMYGSSVWDITLWHDSQANCCHLIGCPLDKDTYHYKNTNTFDRISCHCKSGICHGGFSYNYWVLHPDF
ncbi:uncharacterized protein LOC106646658 [Copidosoma floridanum]|uniref:uncharacterized protein LOC106646658 n=1 Tax=Copidosoma floridanum TaxID=29053 RepID=UPI0006C9685E|nr:uncharacterized protein LOC106646658 [Copidosoma floridanum]